MNVKTSIFKSALLTLPMLLVTALMLTGGKPPSGPEARFSFALVYLFLNASFFMMVRTGKTDKWRAPVFIAMALSFVLTFMAHMIETRGTIVLKDSVMLSGGTPFCHLVIPQTILPLLLSRSIIFPGTMLGGYAAIGSMLAMWILFSLTLGRGWCGWGCFFGGLDDLFSRLRKAPVLSLVSDNWSNVSVAVLIVTVLFSAASLAPFYCSWLCPYKAVTEFREVHGLTIFLQTVVFMTLFIGLVVVLPILTKKRTQCGILCPFGAFQSAANCINPFELRVDAAKCVDCGACVRGCPVFAMTGESKALGRARLNCIKCGKCADICPTGAVYHHVKLTKNAPSRAQRLMFLYPAFIFISTIGGGMMQHAVGRIFRLFTTGSIF